MELLLTNKKIRYTHMVKETIFWKLRQSGRVFMPCSKLGCDVIKQKHIKHEIEHYYLLDSCWLGE